MIDKLTGTRQGAENKLQVRLQTLQSATSVCRFLLGKLGKPVATISTVLLFLLLQSGTAWAQGDTTRPNQMSPVDMAGTMRSNGKIYVVVAVLVIILAGLFTYLTRLDRKITRLEKGTWKDT